MIKPTPDPAGITAQADYGRSAITGITVNGDHGERGSRRSVRTDELAEA